MTTTVAYFVTSYVTLVYNLRAVQSSFPVFNSLLLAKAVNNMVPHEHFAII
jgi:hypothetical protein